jgi:3-phosphoshikimate 1-carboxyvinyltransferase
MDRLLSPGVLSGRVRAIASKSAAHRLLICAALAHTPTRLLMASSSEDIDATIACLRGLGAAVERDSDGVTVYPGEVPDNPVLDCRESGSTLRFLLPVAAAMGAGARFTGSGRLPERPIGELLDALTRHGVSCSSRTLPLESRGKLTAGTFYLPGNVSSQYITGLLLALPVLAGDSDIILTSRLESAGYIDITLHALKRFGICVAKTDSGYHIRGGQTFVSPGTVRVEGDWSNSAFFLGAGAIGAAVSVEGLNLSSPQGDRAVLTVLGAMGAAVETGGAVSVRPGVLRGSCIDISAIPDTLPLLAVVAAFAQGDTVFTGGARLRLKESDRLQTTAAMICGLGGAAAAQPDGLIVRGRRPVGGRVDGAGDHRIVMAAAVAAAMCREHVVITGAEAVNKSYPGFWEDFAKLGGKADVI